MDQIKPVKTDSFWIKYDLNHPRVPTDAVFKKRYDEVQRIVQEVRNSSYENMVQQLPDGVINARPIDEVIMKDFIAAMESRGWRIKESITFLHDTIGVSRKGELEMVVMTNSRYQQVDAYIRRKFVDTMKIDEISAGAWYWDPSH